MLVCSSLPFALHQRFLPSLPRTLPVRHKQSRPFLRSARRTTFSAIQLEAAVPWTNAGNDITDNHFAANEFILNPYTLPLVS